MKSNGRKDHRKQRTATGSDGPGSETERFRAIVSLGHNEAVTGESGVPRHQRDHGSRQRIELLFHAGLR